MGENKGEIASSPYSFSSIYIYFAKTSNHKSTVASPGRYVMQILVVFSIVSLAHSG